MKFLQSRVQHYSPLTFIIHFTEALVGAQRSRRGRRWPSPRMAFLWSHRRHRTRPRWMRAVQESACLGGARRHGLSLAQDGRGSLLTWVLWLLSAEVPARSHARTAHPGRSWRHTQRNPPYPFSVTSRTRRSTVKVLTPIRTGVGDCNRWSPISLTAVCEDGCPLRPSDR